MQEPDGAEGVGAIGGLAVGFGGSGRLAMRDAEGGAHGELAVGGFERAESLALRDVDNVAGFHEVSEAFPAGRVDAPGIAERGEDPRLVENAPVGNAVAESTAHDVRVFGKACGEVAIGPAACVFKDLRQIPVIEGDERANLCFEKRVGEAFVVIDAFRIGFAAAAGLNARPGDGEAVALQVHLLRELDVFFEAAIGITGDVAGFTALHAPASVGETIPDGFAFAVLVPGALYLIGGGSHAPEKSLGEGARTGLWDEFCSGEEKIGAGIYEGEGSGDGGTCCACQEFAAIKTV